MNCKQALINEPDPLSFLVVFLHDKEAGITNNKDIYERSFKSYSQYCGIWVSAVVNKCLYTDAWGD
jgi:hypothetical protein